MGVKDRHSHNAGGDSAVLFTGSREQQLGLLRIALEYKYDVAYAEKLRRQGYRNILSAEAALAKALKQHTENFPTNTTKQKIKGLLRLRAQSLEAKMAELENPRE